MLGYVKHLSARITAYFPDRQILILGETGTRKLHLPGRLQMICAFGVLGLAVWAGISSASAVAFWGGRAALASRSAALRDELHQVESTLAAMSARDADLQHDADAAKARAAAAQALAMAQAQAVENAALAAKAQSEADAAAKIAALDAQTQAAISQTEAIIRAAGLSPTHMADVPAPAPKTDPEHGAALLSRDLGQLRALSGLLGQMPLSAPVSNVQISSGFGYRADPFTGAREFHVGIDLRGPIGTPVYATAPGRVSFAGVETGYGLIVEIDHGYGLSTRYSHLDKILVHVGDVIGLHQTIGLLGNTGWSTGPHLLYETRVDGQPENPLNFIKVATNDVQN